MNRKRLVFFAVIILLTISSIALSRASLLDKILGREPELGPVNVNVGLGNSPPFIVRFFEGPGAIAPPYNLIAGGISQAYIGLVAQDPNGEADLPTTITIGTDINGGIQAPASSVNPGIIIQTNGCLAFNCATGFGGAPVPYCTPGAYNLQKAYICGFTMTYSLPPSTFSAATPSINDLWKAQFVIRDLQGALSPAVITGDPGFNNLPADGVRVNALSAANIPVGSSINWVALSLTTPNQAATGPINIQNYGNVPLTTTQVTGANLAGTTSPTASLSISAFSASGNNGGVPPAQCVVPSTATQLTTTALTIPGVSVPYTASGALVDNDNIYFCAYQTLNTPGILTGTDTSFTGTWQITSA